MMLTVQSIPDVKPSSSSSRRQPPTPSSSSFGLDAGSPSSFDLDNVRFIDDEEDNRNIPYHARQDSRPFSYGVDNAMIQDTSKGLSSPSLVRKASFNKSGGDSVKKVQTQVYPGSNYSTLNKYNSSNYSSSTSPTAYLRKDPIDDIFTSAALSANRQPYRREFREEFYRDETKRYDPLKRSRTEDSLRSPKSPAAVTSPFSDSESLSPPGGFGSSPRSPEFHET